MGRKTLNYPDIEGIELEGSRKELFEVMNDKFPGGNKLTQKSFCFSIPEERVHVYLRDFKRY
jgi:hypothetical protein